MSTAILKTLITGRRAIAMTFVFAIAIASVAGCSARKGTSATIEEGVVINGVRWATRNADDFRTFVSSPEAPGGFYLFSPVQQMIGQGVPLLSNRARDRYTLRRRSGHLTRGPLAPCPPGWRLPTAEEFESLIAAGSVWTTVNGVNGRLFGTAPHQLFLPAAGQFVDAYREIRDVNEKGLYWICRESEPPQSAPSLIQGFPRMLRFNQESIAISEVDAIRANHLQINPLHATSGQAPIRTQDRINRDMAGTTPFVEVPVMRFPELSVRCVAVTDDD